MRTVAVIALAAALSGGAAAQNAREPGEALRYRIVPEKSRLTFELPTTLATVHGEAGRWSGEIRLLPEEPGKIEVRVAIRTASLSTGTRRGDARLSAALGPDEYPLALFEGGTYRGDLAALKPGQTVTIELSGSIEIHGVRRPTTFSVECAELPGHVLLAGALPIHWSDFGLKDQSGLFNRARPAALVIFHLWAEPESPATP